MIRQDSRFARTVYINSRHQRDMSKLDAQAVLGQRLDWLEGEGAVRLSRLYGSVTQLVLKAEGGDPI